MSSASPLELGVHVPALAGPLVSADGRSVAWTWFAPGQPAEVHVVAASDAASARRVVSRDSDLLLAGWRPDSASLMLRTEPQAHDEPVRLVLAELARPERRTALVEMDQDAVLEGVQLHPDGRSVYAAQGVGVSARGVPVRTLYRVDLPHLARRELVRLGTSSVGRPLLNAAGTHLLYSRSDLNRAGRQIWLVDVEGHTDREILNFGPSVKLSGSWLPDGGRVLFLLRAGAVRHLGLWDLRTGRIRWLLDDPRRSVEEAFVPQGSEHAVVLEQRDARLRASLLDIESGVEQALPELPGTLLPLAPAAGGDWIGQYQLKRCPPQVVRFSPREAHPDAFVRLSPASFEPDEDPVAPPGPPWTAATLHPAPPAG